MKKRIISLALVIVMLLSVLCSCSFNYAKKDLTKYAEFNATEFEKALLALVIEDGSFGRTLTDRNKNVLDTIFAALATDAGTDEEVRKYDVDVKAYDVLYYGYYVTFEKTNTTKDENGEDVTTTETITVFPEGMNPAKPGGLQFGISSTKEDSLSGKIEAAVGSQVITNVFKGDAEGTTEANDVVNVSFTFTYTEKDADGKDVSKTVTYNYKNITLSDSAVAPVAEGDETTGEGDQTTGEGENNTGNKVVLDVTKYLIGKAVGKVDKGEYNGTLTVDGVAIEGKFTGLTINWIVDEAGAELATVTDKTYADTTKNVKDVNGNTHDLKGIELTYHIVPMFVVDVVDELSTEVVLKKLLGTDSDADGSVEDSEKGSLELFSNEEYKNGEETLKALIEKLTTAYNDLAKAEKALVTAEAALEKEQAKQESTATPASEETTEKTEGEGETTEGEKPEAEKTPLEKAEAAVESAIQDLATKKTAVDELVAKIAAATNGEKTVAEILADEYKEAVYDNLEASYESTIKTNLSKEIIKLATKYITYTGKLPKRAVKQAYERIEDMHEYNYYQGNYTNADKTTVPNYTFYASYEEYLKSKDALNLSANATMDDCKAAMQKQAEEEVRDLLVVYTLVQHYGIELTKEEKDSAKNNIYVIYLGVSEEDFLHALYWDKVVNHILTEGDEPAEDAEDQRMSFKYLQYLFTDEVETEDEGSTEGSTEGTENNG